MAYDQDARQFVTEVSQFIKDSVKSLSPADALRVLFELDASLYGLQGQLSVAYDGGLHTKHRHMRYHDFFVDRVRENQRVLDLGCGNGALAYDLAEKGKALVTGIDSNPHHIRQAIQQFSHASIQYIHGDIFEVNWEKPFDVVVMSNILEHLKGRVECLRTVVEKTQCQKILIRVPLFDREWRVPLKRELGVEWRLDKTHETEYLLPEFKSEMHLAGLKIEHLEIRWGEIWCEVVPGEAV